MGVISSGTYRLVVEQITSLTGPWSTRRGNSGSTTVTGATDVDAITGSDFTFGSASSSSRALAAGVSGVNDGPYDVQVTFDDDLIYLNADVTPTARPDLPSGFKPTSATVNCVLKSPASPLASVYPHFLPSRASAAQTAAGSVTRQFAWTPPPPVPSMLNLLGDGAGMRVEFSGDPLAAVYLDLINLTGTYDVVAYWWTIPAVNACGVRAENHLQYSSDDPGAPWERLDPDDDDAAPTPVILAVEPNAGDVAGGTAVTIRGAGFGDACTVAFGGTPATSVVTVNSSTITCVAPAHAAGATTVVVTNEDGATS